MEEKLMKVFKFAFAFAFAFVLMTQATSASAFHSDFENNTDSCATCHELHGADDPMLLTGGGGTQACMSCHDSTTKGYSVKNHTNAGTMTSVDGPNNPATESEATGASAHDVGTTTLSAAPGGNASGSGEWGSSFDCTSCHYGHMPASAPDNVAMIRYDITSSEDRAGAVNLEDSEGSIAIYDALDDSKERFDGKNFPKNSDGTMKYAGQYILVPMKVDTTQGKAFGSGELKALVDNSSIDNGDYVLYPFIWVDETIGYTPVTTEITGTPSISGASGSFKVDEKTGVIYGADAAGESFIESCANGSMGQYKVSGITIKFRVDPTMVEVEQVGWDGEVVYKDGEAKTVETSDNNSYWNTSSENYNYGSGNANSMFCLQCHTDYMSSSHSQNNSTYGEEEFRHSTVKSDQYACTRCHYAHGTDKYIMEDAEGNDYKDLQSEQGMSEQEAFDYLNDTESELKRQTGYSSCLSCHGEDVGNESDATGYEEDVNDPY